MPKLAYLIMLFILNLSWTPAQEYLICSSAILIKGDDIVLLATIECFGPHPHVDGLLIDLINADLTVSMLGLNQSTNLYKQLSSMQVYSDATDRFNCYG